MSSKQSHAEPDRSRSYGLVAAIVSIVILYLTPLILVGIDDLVLRTHWFVNTFPAGSRRVFYAIYPFVQWIVPY